MQRFRGSIRFSGWGRRAFWHHLDVDETVLVFWTWLDGETPIERATVHRVEFELIRFLPFRWETNVRVHQTTGQTWRGTFLPFRPGRLRRELEQLGWPVVDVEAVGYLVAIRRAFGVRP